MISTKENLLVWPFVQQKYKNHRKKVSEAGAVIDFQCPTKHPHITLKLKKLQQEQERMLEIERENQRLLTRLGQIMNKNRLNNFWMQPPPNCVHRVVTSAIRPRSKSASAFLESASQTENDKNKYVQRCATATGPKPRCTTCSNTYKKPVQTIPEERIPWEPPRISWNLKIKNNAKKCHKCCKFCC